MNRRFDIVGPDGRRRPGRDPHQGQRGPDFIRRAEELEAAAAQARGDEQRTLLTKARRQRELATRAVDGVPNEPHGRILPFGPAAQPRRPVYGD